jgi:hypothetical protein
MVAGILWRNDSKVTEHFNTLKVVRYGEHQNLSTQVGRSSDVSNAMEFDDCLNGHAAAVHILALGLTE